MQLSLSPVGVRPSLSQKQASLKPKFGVALTIKEKPRVETGRKYRWRQLDKFMASLVAAFSPLWVDQFIDQTGLTAWIEHVFPDLTNVIGPSLAQDMFNASAPLGVLGMLVFAFLGIKGKPSDDEEKVVRFYTVKAVQKLQEQPETPETLALQQTLLDICKAFPKGGKSGKGSNGKRITLYLTRAVIQYNLVQDFQAKQSKMTTNELAAYKHKLETMQAEMKRNLQKVKHLDYAEKENLIRFLSESVKTDLGKAIEKALQEAENDASKLSVKL